MSIKNSVTYWWGEHIGSRHRRITNGSLIDNKKQNHTAYDDTKKKNYMRSFKMKWKMNHPSKRWHKKKNYMKIFKNNLYFVFYIHNRICFLFSFRQNKFPHRAGRVCWATCPSKHHMHHSREEKGRHCRKKW